MKKILLLASALVVVALIGFGVYRTFIDRSTPVGQAPMAEIDPQVFEQFKNDFNQARGRVRIIALLSPT
jgi:hypothetical protein